MMLVVAFNCKFNLTHKGMVFVFLFACFGLILFIYLRFDKLYYFAGTVGLLYTIFNIGALTGLILWSSEPTGIRGFMMLGMVFIPGIYSSLAFFIRMIRIGKNTPYYS
jgi:hypothetical protein